MVCFNNKRLHDKAQASVTDVHLVSTNVAFTTFSSYSTNLEYNMYRVKAMEGTRAQSRGKKNSPGGWYESTMALLGRDL